MFHLTVFLDPKGGKEFLDDIVEALILRSP